MRSSSFRLSGSSPRIRGKLAFSDDTAHWPGIIPANTGKIGREADPSVLAGDHPREYGENTNDSLHIQALHGSSPRIRGKSLGKVNSGTAAGIIPANTGKIKLMPAPGMIARDHPREYGENQLNPTPGISRAGSSPRIRGKSIPMLTQPPELGIIPANTGKIL
mgnify:CR=1 FL=1